MRSAIRAPTFSHQFVQMHVRLRGFMYCPPDLRQHQRAGDDGVGPHAIDQGTYAYGFVRGVTRGRRRHVCTPWKDDTEIARWSTRVPARTGLATDIKSLQHGRRDCKRDVAWSRRGRWKGRIGTLATLGGEQCGRPQGTPLHMQRVGRMGTANWRFAAQADVTRIVSLMSHFATVGEPDYAVCPNAPAKMRKSGNLTLPFQSRS